MEKEKKTAPQGRGAARSLAELLYRGNKTIHSTADTLGVGDVTVMMWICGKIPDSSMCIRISEFLDCSVSAVYEAILNTPNLWGDGNYLQG